MKTMVLVALMVAAGCADRALDIPGDASSPSFSPPNAADVERALQLTLFYERPTATRPTIAWYDNSKCTVICGSHIDKDGNAIIAWHVGMKLSDSDFPLIIGQWIGLLDGGFDPESVAVDLQKRFTATLSSSGL